MPLNTFDLRVAFAVMTFYVIAVMLLTCNYQYSWQPGDHNNMLVINEDIEIYLNSDDVCGNDSEHGEGKPLAKACRPCRVLHDADLIVVFLRV
jgi:hypothetical protein